MKITPIEINNQEFKKSMRGYDPIEVDTFLEMVGSEYEMLINQNKQNENKVLQLGSELKNFKEVEKTLKQTLLNLQENSDKTRENSKKEASLIRKEAEIQAQRMIEQARRESVKMKEEMVTLQSQKDSLVSRLRHILSSHLELLDLLDLDEKAIGKLKDRTEKVFSKTKDEFKGSKLNTKAAMPEKQKETNAKDTENKPEKIDDANIFKNLFGENLELDDK